MFRLILFLCLAQASVGSKQLYVVRLDGSFRGETAETTHQRTHGLLLSFLGSKQLVEKSLVYTYKHGFAGFSARLSPQQARNLTNINGVVSVWRNKFLRLHTTQSWDFLDGQTRERHTPVANESKAAENIIIGILDSGIWPESKSFNDGGMSPIPKRWKGSCNGTLENCNRKIIGARFYYKGFEEENGVDPSGFGRTYFLSARDEMGHGTHTASIAAGRHVEVRNGIARGVARGGAPHARLAVYKVCWVYGICSSADILAGFDDAIGDGVDVISASLGIDAPTDLDGFIQDCVSVGAFHAMRHGIPVVASAGNNGPGSSTVSNVAPWILTVGSTSIDREFSSNIILNNHLQIKGRGLNLPRDINSRWHHLEILFTNKTSGTISYCDDKTALSSKLNGKIIVCLGQEQMANALPKMKHFGVAGVITVDDAAKYEVYHLLLPVTQVGTKESMLLLHYIQNTRFPKARILPTITISNCRPAPLVATDSSRGPSKVTPQIIKPDISAPGVNILAAFPPISDFKGLFSLSETAVHEGYNILSGTSMACPHVTAIVANLKARYPTWSPSAIKSAIMTTANPLDNRDHPIQNYYLESHAGPFDIGAGNLNPSKAMDPGLIYDMRYNDYLGFVCQLGAVKDMDGKRCTNRSHDMNYPSISVANITDGTTTSIVRKVTNVAPCNGSCLYRASFKAPRGIKVKVVPNTLKFNTQSETKDFTIEFKGLPQQKCCKFGSVTWTGGNGHSVTSPFALY